MNRRDFLRRSALVAAGAVAADQVELLERLTHRRVFSSIDVHGSPHENYLDQHSRPWSVAVITAVDPAHSTISVVSAGRFFDSVQNDNAICIATEYPLGNFQVGDTVAFLPPGYNW